MGEVWICEWSASYSDKPEQKYSRAYHSFDEAKFGIRKLISSKCRAEPNIKECLKYLLQEHQYKELNLTVVKFFLDYFTRSDVYPRDFVFPTTEAIDYYVKPEKAQPQESSSAELSNEDNYVDEEYDEEEEMAREYEPKTYSAFIDGDSLYLHSEYISFQSNIVLMSDERKQYDFELVISICGGLESLRIYLYRQTKYMDKAAYPLLILKILQNSTDHLKHDQIKNILLDEYGFSAERKAIGRYLDMLKELDFGLSRDKDGYYIQKKNDSLSAEEMGIIKNAIEAYHAINDKQKAKILDRFSLEK